MVNTGASLAEVRSMIELSEDSDILIETFNRYEHFIVAMSHQYDRRFHSFTTDERVLEYLKSQIKSELLSEFGCVSYS